MTFSAWYVREKLGFSMRASIPSYERAEKAIIIALALNPRLPEAVREKFGSFTKGVAADALVALCPGLPEEIADELASTFDREAKSSS